MSAEFKTDHEVKRAAYFWFDVRDIVYKPEENGRLDLGELDVTDDIGDLIASIRDKGQISPVEVRKSDSGRPILVSGTRRYRAICALNKHSGEPIKIKAVYFKGSPEEAFERNVIENMHRRNTSPMDDAHNIRRLRDVYGRDDDYIASIYRKSTAWVYSRGRLIELSEGQRKALHAGEITMEAALAFLTADMPESEKERLLNEVHAEFPVESPVGSAGNGSKRRGKTKAIKRKIAEATGAKQKRGIGDIREWLTGLDGPGSSDGVKEFAAQLAEFLDGAITERQMSNRLDELIKKGGSK